MCTILAVAPNNQHEAGERYNRKNRAIPMAKTRDRTRARIAKGHESVSPDKYGQP
jgi:hypothetical protein